MRYVLLACGVTAVLSLLVYQTLQGRPESVTQAPAAGRIGSSDDSPRPDADRSADEAAIRANIAQFVKAYNAGDAKAVAALFMPDGLVIDKEGDESRGREAIAKTFAEIFADAPKQQLEVNVESIRFIGSDLAMEVGTTKESAPGEAPEFDRYTVLHVKRDGKWQMAMARDEEGPTTSAHEQLEPLAWLVGEWVDDGGSVVVASTCRWSEDKQFLLQEFDLKVSGKDAMKVSQRIGWDPVAKQIRSWVFDSEGGFGESRWTRDGDDWIIQATGVRPDGTSASATNFLNPIGTDGYVWRSTNRIVAGERQPDTEVKVVRKAPPVKRK